MDKKVVVTVGGIETQDEILNRAPDTQIVVWASPYTFFERSACRKNGFYSTLDVKAECVELVRKILRELGCLDPQVWDGDLIRVFYSPSEVVEVFERHGFEITGDHISSMIIENTKW